MEKGGVVYVGYGIDMYENYINKLLSAIVIQYKEEKANDEIESLIRMALYIDDIFYINNVIKLGMNEQRDLLVKNNGVFLSNFDIMNEDDLKELGYTEEMLNELREMSKCTVKEPIEFAFYANEDFNIEQRLKNIEKEVKSIAKATDAEDDFSFLLDDSEDMEGMEEINKLLSIEKDEEIEEESDEENEIKDNKKDEEKESDIKEDDVIYVERGTGKVKFKTFEEYRKELKKEVEKVEGIRDDDKTMANILGTIYGAGGSIFSKVKSKSKKGEAT